MPRKGYKKKSKELLVNIRERNAKKGGKAYAKKHSFPFSFNNSLPDQRRLEYYATK